jgi:hypothetical protein
MVAGSERAILTSLLTLAARSGARAKLKLPRHFAAGLATLSGVENNHLVYIHLGEDATRSRNAKEETCRILCRRRADAASPPLDFCLCDCAAAVKRNKEIAHNGFYIFRRARSCLSADLFVNHAGRPGRHVQHISRA